MQRSIHLPLPTFPSTPADFNRASFRNTSPEPLDFPQIRQSLSFDNERAVVLVANLRRKHQPAKPTSLDNTKEQGHE